ncbi:MAG: hypothetical protein V6Z89_08275 [Desulfobacter sp.]
MNNKLGMRIAGIASFISGINMYNTGWDHKWGVKTSEFSALFIAGLGCIFFIGSFFLKPKKGIMICEDCNKKYKTEHIQVFICPKCEGKLINIKNE